MKLESAAMIMSLTLQILAYPVMTDETAVIPQSEEESGNTKLGTRRIGNSSEDPNSSIKARSEQIDSSDSVKNLQYLSRKGKNFGKLEEVKVNKAEATKSNSQAEIDKRQEPRRMDLENKKNFPRWSDGTKSNSFNTYNPNLFQRTTDDVTEDDSQNELSTAIIEQPEDATEDEAEFSTKGANPESDDENKVEKIKSDANKEPELELKGDHKEESKAKNRPGAKLILVINGKELPFDKFSSLGKESNKNSDDDGNHHEDMIIDSALGFKIKGAEMKDAKSGAEMKDAASDSEMKDAKSGAGMKDAALDFKIKGAEMKDAKSGAEIKDAASDSEMKGAEMKDAELGAEKSGA